MQPDKGSSDNNGKNLDNVIDELRRVLANEEQSVEAAHTEEPVAAPEPEPTPVSSNDDFWKGNVLGWPSEDYSANPPDSPPTPETIEPVGMVTPIDPIEELAAPPAPPPPATPVTSNPVPPDDKAFLFDVLPPPPLSPLEQEERAQRSIEKEQENDIGLPGSIDSKLPGISQENETVKLDEQTVVKPEGLIQIACIFPKGLEKLGQQFVTALKSVCDKSKDPLNIQAVFIHPWAIESVDVTAWSRSALLSGADIMFVLVPKKEADKFSDLVQKAIAVGIQARLVQVEHVGLRALYADLYVQLRRKK